MICHSEMYDYLKHLGYFELGFLEPQLWAEQDETEPLSRDEVSSPCPDRSCRRLSSIVYIGHKDSFYRT